MPDSVFEMQANPDEVIRAYQEIVDNQKKVESQAKKLRETHKEWNDEMQKSQPLLSSAASEMEVLKKNAKDAAVDGLDALKNSVGAVGAALKVMADIGSQEIDRLNQKTQNFRSQMDSLKASLGMSGDIALLPEVEQQIRDIKSSTLNNKQLTGLFGVAHEQSGGELSLQREIEAVSEASMMHLAGIDPDKSVRTWTELAKNWFADASKEEITDQTSDFLKYNRQGISDDQIRMGNRFFAQGFTGNEIMAILKASGRSNEKAKALEGLQNEAAAEITDQQLEAHKSLSQDQKAQIKTLESKLVEISDEKTKLEETSTSGSEVHGFGEASKKSTYLTKRKSLDIQEQHVRQKIKEIQQNADETVTPEQERLKTLQPLSPGDRIRAILANPDLAPASMRASIRNLQANMEQDEPTGLGQMLTARNQMLNSPQGARFKLMAKMRAREIEQENRASSPSFSDMAFTDMMADDADIQQRIREGKMGRLKQLGSYLSTDYVVRGLMGFGNMADKGQTATNSSDERAHLAALNNIAENTRRRGNTVPTRSVFNKEEK